MKISLVGDYNALPLIKECEHTGSYIRPDWIRKFLREQEARIQAEHELDVAREVCKVLDEIDNLGYDLDIDSDLYLNDLRKIRARYSAKLEDKK